MSITLEEAYHGTTRAFGQNGTQFTAKIPAGSKDGNRIRLRGKGNVTRNGRGDLFLRIAIQPHKTFTPNGANLKTTVAAEVTTAVLGGKVTIPTLTGPVQLTIPAGTQNGQTFRLKGKGMPKQRVKNMEISLPQSLSASPPNSPRPKERCTNSLPRKTGK